MNDPMEECAQAAYHAYVETVGGISFDGRPLPHWGGLGDLQRNGWRVGVKRAFETASASDRAQTEASGQ